jgi:hypothetical protein
MKIDISHPAISFDNSTDTFSAELSDLKLSHNGVSLFDYCDKGMGIHLFNPKTKGELYITRVRVDMDASQEDTYGWLYHGYNSENGRNVKFLFIND